jgi:hypothetical protein
MFCEVHKSQCKKISALLLEYTIVEHCAVIQFLWSEEVNPSEIHRRMLTQYGENFIPIGGKVSECQNKCS